MNLRRLLAVFLALIVPPGTRLAEAQLVGTVSKTVFETVDRAVDFTQVIGTDGLTLVAVRCFQQPTNVDMTAQIIATSPAPLISGDQVSFRIQSGSVGTFTIDVQIQDQTNGQQYEAQITLLITSQP